MQWEYIKIDLNGISPKMDDTSVLARAGAEGWELVVITATNVAYLKRPASEGKSAARHKR